MAAWKSPQIAPQVEFCENAKYRELRPDSARSAEIPQNPGKCKSAGGVLHKSNTATNFFIRDGRVAAWQSQVGKSHTGEKSTLRPISIDQPMFFTWPRRAAPAFWLFECRRRFGAISPNLTSAAEESGLIPAEMECGLSCPAAEGKEGLKSSRGERGSEKPHYHSAFEC